MKFATLNADGDQVAFAYGDVFYREPLSRGERLTIGPSGDHVDLMLALASSWPASSFFVLYVLLISHTGASPGRYQSPSIESFEDLQVFLYTFQDFLESDGRHHIWIYSPEAAGTLVYDQHNVIFAYGDLARYEATLRASGLRSETFAFPVPHCHNFPPNHAHEEEEILAYFDWQYSPLQPGDEYD